MSLDIMNMKGARSNEMLNMLLSISKTPFGCT